MEKKGKFQWGGVAATAVGTAIAMGMGFFADEIVEWLREHNLQAKGKGYYEEMLKAHPALKKEDPAVVARYWASLMHFSPFMAADPLSSGAFIRQSIARGYVDEYGGPPVDTYSTLAGISKSIADARGKTKRRFSDIADAAAGSVVGKTVEDYAGIGQRSLADYNARLKREQYNYERSFPRA